MQAAVAEGDGAIAAILGLEDEQIEAICAKASAGQHVSAVNFNAPGQVAIAGHTEAVERATESAKAAGAKRAIRLPLSVPVHCELMRPAADAFSEILAAAAFETPKVPVIHNVDVSEHDHPEQIRRILTEQVYRPVRWSATIQALSASGVDTVVEMGPGKVLTGLARRIERGLTGIPVTDIATLEKALELTASSA